MDEDEVKLGLGLGLSVWVFGCLGVVVRSCVCEGSEEVDDGWGWDARPVDSASQDMTLGIL